MSSGKKISEIANKKKELTNNPDSVVYKIPCKGCDSTYIGETSRGLATRIYEHRNDVRHHRTHNAMVVHIEETGHLPDWQSAYTIDKGLKKQDRKIIEAAHITTNKNINTATGFFKLGKVTAQMIINERSQSGNLSAPQ